MTRRIALVVVLVAVLLGWHRARASVVEALDLAELVAQADHVLVVTAVAEHARWSKRGHHIVTDVELRADDTLKGTTRPGELLVATRLGGRIGDVALQVPGEARLAPGQRAIVFLATSAGELHFVGMAQGVLALSGSGAATMAMPAGGGMALVERSDDGALVPGRPALTAPRPLAELATEIRKLSAPR